MQVFRSMADIQAALKELADQHIHVVRRTGSDHDGIHALRLSSNRLLISMPAAKGGPCEAQLTALHKARRPQSD